MQNAVIHQSFVVRHEFRVPLTAARKVVVKYFYPNRSGSGELIASIEDESGGLIRADISAAFFDRLGLWRFQAVAEISDDVILKSDVLLINAVSEGQPLR